MMLYGIGRKCNQYVVDNCIPYLSMSAAFTFSVQQKNPLCSCKQAWWAKTVCHTQLLTSAGLVSIDQIHVNVAQKANIEMHLEGSFMQPLQKFPD